MKTRLSLILSFIFMILAPTVMASVADSPQSLVDTAHHYFDLQSSMGASEFDVSIVLLGKLFGPIGPFFPWGSNTLLSTLIQYFNLGILCFASAVISSTVLTHVINTSGKADEAWKQTSMSKLLVRTGLSITSLVPLQTGYSALQVMLMWIVIQSVHVADGIWNLTQSSLKEYRSLVTQVAGEGQQSSTDVSTQRSQATLIKAVLPLSSSLVKSQLCYYRNLAKTAADKSKLNALTAHTLPVSATGSSNDPQIIWTHPSRKSAGGVKYNFGTGKSLLPGCGTYTLGSIKGIKPEDSFSAFQALFFQADRLAHSIWTTEFKPKFSGSTADQLQGLCQVASQCQISDVQTPEAWVSSLVKDKPGIPHCQDKQYCCLSSTAKSCYNSSDLSSISLGYALQLQAFYNPPTSDTQVDQDQQLGKGGWITAGNYYYELAQSAANDSDKDFADLITKAISHSVLKTQDIYLKGMYGYVDNYLDKSVKQQLNKTPSNTDSGTLVNNLYAAVIRFMPDGGFDFSSINSDEHWKDVPVFAKKPWNSVSTFGDAFWCGIGFPGDRTCTVSTANDSFW
ncbi:hypothetical protein N9Y17_04730, partial [Gammaproteobacteria bacterium]|nr:hypothetical protein [Gammaproteobacteria bacterium]